MGGDYKFLPGRVRSSSRQIASMTGKASAYWAAGTGERILMDLWKEETSDRLRREYGCYPIIKQNSSIDIERIQRDARIPDGQNCSMGAGGNGGGRTNPQGSITDANLWLWLYGPQNGGDSSPKLGVPPKDYTAFKTFSNFNTAASYVLDTANKLAQ
jgi:hypothetical protein